MRNPLTHTLSVLGTVSVLLSADNCSAAVTFIEWTVASGGNGHVYGVTDSASDWQTAENAAIALGGHLASITSLAEQSFIENTFLVGALEFRPVWIGLTDQASEGIFSWVTGEPLSYTKWKSGEPNNNGGNEDYTAINWEHGRGGPLGTWNDTPLGGTGDLGAGTTGPYFGLIEADSAPEPSAMLLFGLGCCGLVVLRRRTVSGGLVTEYR